ncbi:MAG: hypothetical protein KatS3mg068_1565 [Candidatus Sericytochromatia bacterium]|nr:MAG: hypothetical protein KatS3mg068_1565 [Candidatus Sericytochromatia bacterium]
MWLSNVFSDNSILEKFNYYLEDNILIINADCREVLYLINNNSVDCCITDPPYNIGDSKKYTKYKGNFKTNDNAWGDLYQDFWENQDDYWDWLLNITLELKNKVKYHYVYFLDRTYIGHFNYLIRNHFEIKNLLVFIKTNPIPHFRKNNFRSSFELSVWFSNNYREINFTSQDYMKNIFEGTIGNKKFEHPNYKYDWMIKPFVLTLLKDNDIVIDIFSGSGSILYHIFKYNHTIRCIGIEKNKEIYESSIKNIKSVLSQKILF